MCETCCIPDENNCIIAPPNLDQLNTVRPSHKVCYIYHPEIGNYHYGVGHPMKPHRVRLTNALLRAYGVLDHVDHIVPKPADALAITAYHTDDYIAFLRSVNGGVVNSKFTGQLEKTNIYEKYNISDDCPIFDGLWEFCQLYAGGSIAAARTLTNGTHQTAIHWAGGLHHGKSATASGFCYVNDCVLAILELLQKFQRVLYVDLDVHHGDGVEEAFYGSNRVLTLSAHKRGGGYFPGTGSLTDIGALEGTGYAVNLPLRDGITDEPYEQLLSKVLSLIQKYFQPEVAVIQSGGDSLAGDRLGCFNLTLQGHSIALREIKKWNIPILLLGGGGYTLRNVPKAWANETALATNTQLTVDIPADTKFRYYYEPSARLEVRASNLPDSNDKCYLDKLLQTVGETLRSHVKPTGRVIEKELDIRPSPYAAVSGDDIL